MTFQSLAYSLLLSYGTVCFGSEPPSQENYLFSTDAHYDGSALKLIGHVILHHGLGKMTAEEASLQKQEIGKDFPFSLIELKNQVHLSTKEGGNLTCDAASLDFSSLKGSLTAPIQGVVTFTDQTPKLDGPPRCIALKSPVLDLTFDKIESPTKAEYQIETVLASQGVNVEYNRDFLLQADRALYKLEDKQKKGCIFAYPKDEQNPCLLTHLKDMIQAQTITLDTLHSTVSFHEARGHIASVFASEKEGSLLSFATEDMVWDEPLLTLHMKGRSTITDPGLGEVHSDCSLTIWQTNKEGKKQVSCVETKGPSSLIYKDRKTGAGHTLSSHGSMKIDRDTLHATLCSPAHGASKIPMAEQVYYEELKMGVRADSAAVEFSEEGGKIEPLCFALKGNVTVVSRDPAEPVRCAIADRMSYNPHTKTLILSANPGQKVLFWDESQAVRMSAQEVHLTQSGAAQQTVIQGVGNVKFFLSTEENEVLKKVFPQFKPQMQGG